MTIRAAQLHDVHEFKSIIAATALFPPEMLDDMIAPFFGELPCDDRWLAAQVDDAVVAVAYFAPERMTDGTWNLLLIALRPQSQGHGVGAAVMRHIEAELARATQRMLIVETSSMPAFERTRGFYESIGYEREARIRDFYDAGDDKIVFRKLLQRP